MRHRKTKDELEKVIIEHVQKVIDCPTVERIFYEWLDVRLDRGEIEKSTYSRYERDFARYFTKIKSCKIQSITELMLEDFIIKNNSGAEVNKKSF